MISDIEKVNKIFKTYCLSMSRGVAIDFMSRQVSLKHIDKLQLHKYYNICRINYIGGSSNGQKRHNKFIL